MIMKQYIPLLAVSLLLVSCVYEDPTPTASPEDIAKVKKFEKKMYESLNRRRNEDPKPATIPVTPSTR